LIGGGIAVSDRIIVFTGAFGVLGQAMAMEAAARVAAVASSTSGPTAR
jgi:hypothetical protein